MQQLIDCLKCHQKFIQPVKGSVDILSTLFLGLTHAPPGNPTFGFGPDLAP